ncbi:hypothetical protein PC129_g15118 [Phytophthora cactorum]|uniref:Homeodomain-like n=1 Tax=Phytophthora cactorum TaxID=29920 RepID=A0A8T1LL84_9STRA|nr:hypothetical protein Pcac1_g4011 [Phytophthora cactorum]KAG2917174.1 hypothetical protein PC117_g17528 [Phytophthora cactorum]KAG2928182.1 hypothetical protein PC114_g3202 [Phytophthora cactorum]KAG2997512.1 hypothetical protein PC119_g17649 [Phytophthora cactorum]KAG3033243.1 hypothetical protein PC120_g2020 [Phytophthora cactorum]
MTTTVPQEPTRPPTSSPRRLATAEERQRVLTVYERGDDWLTVTRYNNMSRAAAYQLCKTGDPSPPARGGARASVVKYTEDMVTSCGGCTEDGGHAVWDIG